MRVSQHLAGSEYEKFSEAALYLTKSRENWPSIEALKAQWALAK